MPILCSKKKKTSDIIARICSNNHVNVNINFRIFFADNYKAVLWTTVWHCWLFPALSTDLIIRRQIRDRVRWRHKAGLYVGNKDSSHDFRNLRLSPVSLTHEATSTSAFGNAASCPKNEQFYTSIFQRGKSSQNFQ